MTPFHLSVLLSFGLSRMGTVQSDAVVPSASGDFEYIDVPDAVGEPAVHRLTVFNSGATAPMQKTNVTIMEPEEETEIISNALLPVIITLVLVLLIATVVLAFFIWEQKKKYSYTDDVKEDPFLYGRDGEKIPVPMFEDDMPSVLEVDMEDLDKWVTCTEECTVDQKTSRIN